MSRQIISGRNKEFIEEIKLRGWGGGDYFSQVFDKALFLRAKGGGKIYIFYTPGLVRGKLY